MRILFFGDVCGRHGRRVLARAISSLKPLIKPDVVIANGENAAGGAGVTPTVVEEILDAGVDLITTGSHFFDKREYVDVLQNYPNVLVPGNYPGMEGRGIYLFDRFPLAVINLHGQVFVGNIPLNNPFEVVERLLKAVPFEYGVLLDFHAEATSEKYAMFWFLAGRVSAVVGTHTHVQTADAFVHNGTAYISDVGMCGCWYSVIGVDIESALSRLRFGHGRLSHPKKCLVAVASYVFIDIKGKEAVRIERGMWFERF